MTVAHFDFFDRSGNHLDRIDVKLLDTRGALAWAYAVLLNSSNRTVLVNRVPATPLKETNTVCLQEIHSTIAELSSLGYTYPENFPTEWSDLTTEHFNSLHRYFTESSVELWSEKTKPLNETFKVNRPFQRLNNLIHQLELTVPTDRRIDHWTNGKEIMFRSDDNNLGYDIKPFRDCHSFDHHDVVIDAYILGKTLLESYLCDDDPRAWDTSGNIRTNGGCVFLLTDYRAQLYQSSEFNQWLTNNQCGHHNTQADFPVGNFLPGSKIKAEKLLTLPLWQIDCRVSVTI